MKYAKLEDNVRVSRLRPDEPQLDLTPMLGSWVNTDDGSQGITNVILAERCGQLVVRVFGARDPAPGDWGVMEADNIYGSSINAEQAAAFSASCSFDFAETHLQGNLNQGLLVISSFNRFKDGSNRSNYFSREFFHR